MSLEAALSWPAQLCCCNLSEMHYMTEETHDDGDDDSWGLSITSNDPHPTWLNVGGKCPAASKNNDEPSHRRGTVMSSWCLKCVCSSVWDRKWAVDEENEQTKTERETSRGAVELKPQDAAHTESDGNSCAHQSASVRFGSVHVLLYVSAAYTWVMLSVGLGHLHRPRVIMAIWALARRKPIDLFFFFLCLSAIEEF